MRRRRSCQLPAQQLARGRARKPRRRARSSSGPCSRRAARDVVAQLGRGRARARRRAPRARSPTRPTPGAGGRRRRPRRRCGCSSSTASTSAGATFSPPVTIVSHLRPITVRRPSSSRRPRSPVRSASHSPTTVGPEMRISPSCGDGQAGAGQRAAGGLEVAGLGERDGRARLGEAVGLGDGEAGVGGAAHQRRRHRAAAEQHAPQPRARAAAGVEDAREHRRDERDERDVALAQLPARCASASNGSSTTVPRPRRRSA